MQADQFIKWAGWAPHKAGHTFREQRIDEEKSANAKQDPAANPAQGLQAKKTKYTGYDRGHHWGPQIPAFLDDPLAIIGQKTGGPEGDGEQDPVVLNDSAGIARMAGIDQEDQG